MKFPKLINGGTAVGESLARTLDNVDAPFLTKVGMTSSAQKKNGFTEVRQKQQSAYLWMSTVFVDGAGSIEHAPQPACNSIDMTNLLISPAHMKQHYSYGAFGRSADCAFKLVGDNYILRTFCSKERDYWAEPPPGFGSPPPALFWPAIMRTAGNASEVLASAAGALSPTTFLETVYTGGILGANLGSVNTFVTGAIGGKEDGFGGGMSNLVCAYAPSDLSVSLPYRTFEVPQLWTFDTRTKVAVQRGVRSLSRRRHFPFSVFNAGRGKLIYLHGVFEAQVNLPYGDSGPVRFFEPQKKLWISTSDDHGGSFQNRAAAFLDPFLRLRPISSLSEAVSLERPIYDNNQLRGLCTAATFVYIGVGKSLLMIPNGWTGEAGFDPYNERRYTSTEYDDTYGNQFRVLLDVNTENAPASYCPMVFLFDGDTFTRLSWPPDAWRTDVRGVPDDGIRTEEVYPDGKREFRGVFHPGFKTKDSVGVLRGDAQSRTLSWAFGEGCAAIPVLNEDTGWRLLVTRDFGRSWSFAALPEGIVSASGGGPPLCVIKPYIDAERTGRILFQVAPAGGSTVQIVETDGTFGSYKHLARFKLKGRVLTSGIRSLDLGLDYFGYNNPWGTRLSSVGSSGGDPWEHQLIYTGGDLGPQYVFPAFPGEFEPDRP